MGTKNAATLGPNTVRYGAPARSDSLPATGRPVEPIAKESRSLLDSALAIGYAASFLSLRSV